MVARTNARGYVPPTGTMRLYVDGTAGNDRASGTSWATAWKTGAKLTQGMGELLFANPNDLLIVVYLRGAFDSETISLGFPLSGTSRFILIHALSDHTNTSSGTLNGAAAYDTSVDLLKVTIAGFVPAAGDVTKILQLVSGGNEATFTIVRVSGQDMWVTASNGWLGSPKAWMINGITAKVWSPTITGIHLISLKPNHGGYTYDGVTFAGGPRCGVIQVPAELLELGDITFGVGSYSASYPIKATGSADGFVMSDDAYPNFVAPDAIMVEAGFRSSGANGVCFLGLCAPNGQMRVDSGWGVFAGMYKDVFAIDGAYPSVQVAYVAHGEAYSATLNLYGCFMSHLSGASGVVANHGAQLQLNSISFVDLPAAGVTGGLINLRKGGWLQLGSNVIGNNTGSGGSLYGIYMEKGSNLQAESGISDNLKGKHGRIYAKDSHISFDANMSWGAGEGGGPDMYFEGCTVWFGGNFEKTAKNTAASTILEASSTRITQASGKTFIIAGPTAAWGTDYGSNGAIYLHENADARLRTLTSSGGAGASSTGTACKVKNGSKLIHGGAGLSGVQPLDLGGLPGAIPWPSEAQTDLGAETPQLCMVIPSVT